jgi:hypothetical protein
MNNFSIFKNTHKEKDSHPDYTISVKVGESYEQAGGCWIKDGKSGKFFSCKLNEQYKDRAGFELAIVPPPAPKHDEKAPEAGIEYPADDINPDDIPF